jgi:UDP-glucuronate decarboxylase
MMLGDGNKKGDTYYSNSYKLIGNFQELLLKMGYAGNIKEHDKRKPKSVHQIHLLNRFNKRFRTPTYPMRSVKSYDGYVYCVNVPNHVIFVRRNGKALFCGNCYDEGKRLAETLMMDYHRQNKVDTRIARIFNTYGPRMLENDGRVVSNFIMQALEGKDLTVYGSGQQTRSFCYVDDLVEVLIRLMNKDGLHEPVNLGNPDEFTIKELAEEVARICGVKAAIQYGPLPEDDPRQRQPDITRAQQLLGWTPTIPLREGLRKTVAYFSGRIEDNSKKINAAGS